MAGADVLFHLASALGASRLKEERIPSDQRRGARRDRSGRRGRSEANRPFQLGGRGGPRRASERRRPKPRPRPAGRRRPDQAQGERIALEFAADGPMSSPSVPAGSTDRRPPDAQALQGRGPEAGAGRGAGRTLQTPVYIDDLIEGHAPLRRRRDGAGEIDISREPRSCRSRRSWPP